MKRVEPTVIVGAGLSGLIAAHAWRRAEIWERASEPRVPHRALLRFRSPDVGTLVNIPFRRVTVQKAVCSEDGDLFSEATIADCNAYCRKIGMPLSSRSIGSLDPVERYVAPENFYELLLESVGDRIRYDRYADLGAIEGPCVSTAPLPVAIESAGLSAPAGVEFRRRAIRVDRFRVDDSDTYQTIYFPHFAVGGPIYRASITGDLLIIESTAEVAAPTAGDIGAAINMFGLARFETSYIDSDVQHFGKIQDIDPSVRKRLLLELTMRYRVYSLGRFATWRNILLDDVVRDIERIDRMMSVGQYDALRMSVN